MDKTETAKPDFVEMHAKSFDSLNDLSGVNALAGELGLPTVRNPLPDLRSLRAAADGDLSALGALADNEGSIHEAMSDRGVTLDPNTIGEVCSGIRHILDGWEK